MAEKWTCPYCSRPCTIGEADDTTIFDSEYISIEYGTIKSKTRIIVCPNTDCREKTVSLTLLKLEGHYNYIKQHEWHLLPESSAKPFPSYIPKALLEDYREACLIKDKSPKASATLSRRCIQGIIRDFWEIKKGRLVDEITALEEKIDPITWGAIDAVRSIGNIGAHMEKDVNIIIDVDPREANMLIELIEVLFEECYIHRFERQQKMERVTRLAQDKKTDKKNQKQAAAAQKK